MDSPTPAYRPEKAAASPKGLLIAGVHSGSGKTSLTMAMLAALKRKGLTVQAFKVGPDFIDPGHHTQVLGRPSHNLDGWMLSREENLAIFSRYAAGSDVVVVEGVMGLYDGSSGSDESGSSAQMAKWLGLPVLLCVDAKAMARTLGAIALGFQQFDPQVAWAGLIANRVGSDSHVGLLREAMDRPEFMRFWGGLRRDEEISLPERHLGLVTAEEAVLDAAGVERLADWLEAGIDLPALMDSLPGIPLAGQADSEAGPIGTVRIGVARDKAFCFYYEENLRRLRAAGAELVSFSPLTGHHLPKDLAGLYIGGGYPEVFAEELSRNRRMIEDVRRFAQSGGVIYAECGGLMYLADSIDDQIGRRWKMAGLFPIKVAMLDRLKSLGYREIVLNYDTILGPAGLTARGHEFHYSEVRSGPAGESAFRAVGRSGRETDAVGYADRNILASYVHLHFGSRPELAPNLVKSCLAGLRRN